MKKTYKIAYCALFLFLSICTNIDARAQIIATAGATGVAGYSGDGGSVNACKVNMFYGSITFDAAGNLYVADDGNNVVRKVSTSGVITTIAGNNIAGYSGDGGPATAASMRHPIAVAADASGNLYIAEWGGDRIRKVTSSGIISTYAGNGTRGFGGDGGPATAAKLYAPAALALDASGNLYIADGGNARIRKVSASGTITTFAGNGSWPYAGDGGPATAAQFDGGDLWLAIDGSGDLYIADGVGHRVRKVNSSGIINTIAGTGTMGFSGDGGPATAATLSAPWRLAFDAGGNLYISDWGNYRIRKVNTSGVMSSVAGNGTGGYSGDGGPATAARIDSVTGIAANGAYVYFATGSLNRLRRIGPSSSVSVESIGNPLSMAMSVYPNPTSGNLSVGVTTANNEEVSLSISNIVGVEMARYPVSTNSRVPLQLELPAGIYFLAVNTSQGVARQRVIVE